MVLLEITLQAPMESEAVSREVDKVEALKVSVVEILRQRLTC